jgi:ATPase subunit of ABC transporter with duplicated ATPase domains
MIHLTGISKQHGSQILFQNASFQILPGSRSGLVGPNGAGKTTIFRLITGEEQPDSGEISCSRKNVVGYFSQDVGEMSGRSVKCLSRTSFIAMLRRRSASQTLRIAPIPPRAISPRRR